MSTTLKYPYITVKILHLGDDKAAIILTCLRALKQHKIIDQLPMFVDHISKAGSNELIKQIKDWFNVE